MGLRNLRWCSAPNCRANSIKHCVNFFSFPAEEEKFKLWTINAKRPDLLKRGSLYCSRRYHLCAWHFENNMFSSNDKSHLVDRAVPVLFIWSQACSSSLKSGPTNSSDIKKRTPSKKNNTHLNRKGYVESLRAWQNITQLKSPVKPGIHLTVMCYNVLAQDLIVEHPNIYRYHDQKTLKWQVRWHNILNEIRQMDPDILCLQEVQESHLKDYYTTLESLGYRAIYKKKTGYKIDGCAIYYKSDKLNLVDYTTVEYFQHNVNVLNRDNIGIVARFAPRNSSKEFVVSTTHLLYNPRRQDVRLAQMQILLAEIDRMAYDKNGNYNSYVPLIITGDLNSKPDSALYKFIVNGKLHYEKLSPRTLLKTDAPVRTGKVLVPSHLRVSDYCQHADLIKLRQKHGDISRQDGLNFVRIHHSERPYKSDNYRVNGDNSNLFSSGTLYHNFALKSVYSHINNNDVEGTTFQDEWITVDYIFYSGRKEGEKFQEEKLKLLSRYRLPTRTELNGVRIPNATLGSDHLCLIGRFFLEY